jgi:hypothetical protein
VEDQCDSGGDACLVVLAFDIYCQHTDLNFLADGFFPGHFVLFEYCCQIFSRVFCAV